MNAQQLRHLFFVLFYLLAVIVLLIPIIYAVSIVRSNRLTAHDLRPSVLLSGPRERNTDPRWGRIVTIYKRIVLLLFIAVIITIVGIIVVNRAANDSGPKVPVTIHSKK